MHVHLKISLVNSYLVYKGYNGHAEVAQYLLEQGAKVDAARPNNTTPLCNNLIFFQTQ